MPQDRSSFGDLVLLYSSDFLEFEIGKKIGLNICLEAAIFESNCFTSRLQESFFIIKRKNK